MFKFCIELSEKERPVAELLLYHAVTLTFDLLTLNFGGRSGIIWANPVQHFSEIKQFAAAELLTI